MKCNCTCARVHPFSVSRKRLGGLCSNLVSGGVCGCEVCGCEINGCKVCGLRCLWLRGLWLRGLQSRILRVLRSLWFTVFAAASFAEFAVYEVCGCEYLVARFADTSFAVERFAVASLRFAAFRFAIFSLQGSVTMRVVVRMRCVALRVRRV